MGNADATVAVVTGAAHGIGQGIARRLARDGYYVAVADIDADAADVTVNDIVADGGAGAAYVVDVTDYQGIQDFRERLTREHGAPEVLVNNAGWEQVRRFEETDPQLWERLVRINYLGMVGVTHALLGPLQASPRGRVVNIASDAGRVGSSGETVYAGTKGGIIAFTKSLAREVARHGVTVNCVCPGPTDTRAFADVPQRLQEALIRAIPLRRIASPADIANAVAFFATEGSGYITGQVLSVNGGLTMVG